MTNLAGLPPVGLKDRASPKDREYLRKVAQEPCIVCQSFGEAQASPTTVHHVCHGRFSTRKTPDCMAIPLCDGHHQAEFDGSKLSIHQDKAEWRKRYGPDYDFTPIIQDRLGYAK
jgi:hypothetical protein